MTSPTLNTYAYERPSFSELRLTPTPAEDYKCPVSTPANYVQGHSRIRRTKPRMDNLYDKPPPVIGRQQRTKGMALTRHSRNVVGPQYRLSLETGNTLDCYYRDRYGDKKEEEQTNTYWLKALCSQPVDEILNKYRRKSEVKRTRVIWCKTFTTPGEKSLLSAWENNVFQSKRRRGQVKSAYHGAQRRGELNNASRQDYRLTKSEPPLSRVYNPDFYSGSVTPASPRKEMRSPQELDQTIVNMDSFPDGSPRRKIGEMISEDPSNRMSSYVTQYFVPKGSKGPVYSTVVTSPDLLPKLSNRQKIVASLVAPGKFYNAANGDG